MSMPTAGSFSPMETAAGQIPSSPPNSMEHRHREQGEGAAAPYGADQPVPPREASTTQGSTPPVPDAPVAWVLGAGREPTRSLTLTLAQQGFRLALYDLNPAALEATAAQVRGLAAAEPFPLTGDLVRKIALQALLNRIEDHWGRLDVVVYGLEANPAAPLDRLDEWDWHRALDINLTVPWLLAQMAARVMRGGALFFIGGDEPLYPPHDKAGLPLRAGRGGLLAALPQWAEMLTPARVRVHLLLPQRPYDPLWRAVARPARALWLRDTPRDLPALLLRLLTEPFTGAVLYPGK